MLQIQYLLIVVDLSIFIILIFLIVGFLSFDYHIFNVSEPLIHIPGNYKPVYEVLPWVLFSLLIVDLVLKYRTVNGNLKYFIKKYWFDIMLTALIPVLFPLKFIKPALKIYKSTKVAKSSFKLFQKYDSIFKLKK